MDDVRTSKEELVDGWCWRFASEADRRYHDAEWGVPVHDDTRMFEHLSLECLQCGLSWDYVLKRRELFRAQFHGFDIDAVAAMDDDEVQRTMEVPGILRNPPKLHAIVGNARAAQRLREEFGSFNGYFWSWTDGKAILYQGHQKGGLPASNGLSAKMAADLKKRGFKYVGPTNVYAHLQACGIICDHNERCPRYAYVIASHPTIRKRCDAER
jgi:DNA-3-methyladenine glycosylase I